MSELLRRAATYWPVTAVLVGLPIVAAILYGCESRPQTVVEVNNDDAGERCATLLEAGIRMVRPESLGLVSAGVTLDSDPKQAADMLSQWLRLPDCRDASPMEPLSDASKELLTRLLGPDGVEQVTTERLSAFDAAHVRDALLDFSAADNLVRGADSDLDRVVRLFEYVTRTVTPQGEGTVELPLTAYEAHLFGRGSAEDRAWLFAALLRQLRVDAVVLRPSAGSSETDAWWVGVLLDDSVYLFDPTLGLPVPSPDAVRPQAPVYLPSPATLSQAVATPEILVAYRREAGLEAPPIAAEQLRSPRVELIGPSSFWKASMERLELSLTEDRGVLLYDPLHDTQTGPGLYRRVVEAAGGSWLDASISIWPHTERVRTERADLAETQQQRLQARIRPYFGPVVVNADGPTHVAEPPSKQLWETRVEHMSGRPGGAIGSYQLVRLEPDSLLSPNDQSLNDQAADEAYFWTAQAQFGGGQYEPAAATIQKYVEQGGDRSDEAAALRVISLAAEGKTAQAAAAVRELAETTPGLARLQWLAAWWRNESPQSDDSAER